MKITVSILLLLLATYLVAFVTSGGGGGEPYLNRLKRLFYDDSYLTNNLDERYPYLKLNNGGYLGPRDYFNFTHVYEPNEAYFKRVNLEEHLYDELRAMEISSSVATMDQWHYSDDQELRESGWPEANEQRCAMELNRIQALLDEAKENSSRLFERNSLNNVQLLRYMDSWARPPSETYHGHSYWVGSYRACQMAKLQLAADSSDATRFGYCWAKLRMSGWPDEDEMVPPTSIRAGVCLPKSCDTISANKQLEAIHRIMLFNFSPLHRDRFNKLINVYCLPRQAGLSFEGKMFASIIIAWLALVLSLSAFVSLLGYKLPNALYCLTLQDNFRRLAADGQGAPVAGKHDRQSAQQQVDLRPLGLVRLVAILSICLAHCACSFSWVFNASTFMVITYRSPIALQIIPSIFKALDLYLVIAGLLSSYLILKRFPGDKLRLIVQPRNYLQLITARYYRLAPMMVLVLAFMKSIYLHLSDGPMWDYGTYKYSMQSQCKRSSWWRILGLPILFDFQGNSYVNECLPVSWYLITDLKISLVIPLIVYLMMSRFKRKQWLPTVLLVFVSTVSQYKDLSMQQLVYFKQFFHYGLLPGVNMLNLTFGEPGYYSAINRLHAVALGLLAGVRLHQYQVGSETNKRRAGEKGIANRGFGNDEQNARWPFWMRGPFFWAAISWEVYDFFAPILVHLQYLSNGITPSEETIKLAMVLKPRLDAFIFSIILLRFVTDLAPTLMKFSLFFNKLSKLSYCVLLVHPIVISYLVSANERSRPDSLWMEFFMQVTFVITFSFMISFPLYLLVESPIAQLLSIPSSPSSKLAPVKGSGKRKNASNEAAVNQQETGKEMSKIQK